MKNKEEITKEYGYLRIGNKYYSPERTGTRWAFTEVSKKEYDKKISLIKEIAEKLINTIDKKEVLMEALSKINKIELEYIHKDLYNSKRPVKPKFRKHNCVDIKVGRSVIPIIE
jgi:hypothetical protein